MCDPKEFGLMDGLDLNAEQQAEVHRIEELLAGVFRNEARMMAQLLASKPNGELLGGPNFSYESTA
jgi:hypothetical protein